MNTEELQFIIKICTAIIGILISGVGFFLYATYNELKSIKTEVHGLKVAFQGAVSDVSTLKDDVGDLKEKADEAAKWRGDLFRDFKLEKR